MLDLIHVGTGRNRIVYRRRNIVIKFPLNDYGIYDNNYEYRFYKKHKKSGFIPYANCKIWKNNVLIMEYIKHVGWKDGQPDWCNFVDCGQVGMDKNNKLVAYDFGYY